MAERRHSTNERTPTGRKEIGSSYYILGWLLLLAALGMFFFVPSEMRAGHWLWQLMTYGTAAAGVVLVLYGRAKRTKAKRELNV